MADQVPAAIDNAPVIQALDGQAPQDNHPVQAWQDYALASQVQAVGPVQPREPTAEMVGSFIHFTVCLFFVPVVITSSLPPVTRLRLVCFTVALDFVVLPLLYIMVWDFYVLVFQLPRQI